MSYLTDKDWEDILADSSTLGKNQEVDEPSPERSCFEEPNQPNFFDSLLDDASTCEDHGITQASTPPTITQPETSTDAGQGSEVQGRDVFWEIDILKARILEQSRTIEALKLDAQVIEHLKTDVRNIGMYVTQLEPFIDDMRNFIKELLEKVVVKWEIKSPTLPTLHEKDKDN